MRTCLPPPSSVRSQALALSPLLLHTVLVLLSLTEIIVQIIQGDFQSQYSKVTASLSTVSHNRPAGRILPLKCVAFQPK